MISRPRLFFFIACSISVALCFIYADFRYQLPVWWRDHGGGVPYVLFWIMLGLVIAPNKNAISNISVLCVLATCCLEFLQLWQVPLWLETFRQTTFGAALLGRGFDWSDFPPYFIGGVLGWVIGRIIHKLNSLLDSS